MNADRKALADLIDRWHVATGEGDVETAISGDMRVEHRAEGGAVGDVEPVGARFISLFAQTLCLALGGVAVDVGQGHLRASFGHRLGISEADAGSGAGDDRRAAGNVELVERLHR